MSQTPPDQTGTELRPATRIAIGVGIAIAILVAAWFVGGQTGLSTVGTGGINRSLLPKVGDVAPDFETSDLFGNPVRLSDFRGQPIWLMFWGSWCPPCRAEFPEVQSAYEMMAPEGLELLGVSIRESALDAASYAAQNGATWLVLSDPDEADTGAGYPLYNVPTHLFIDADGVIRSIVISDMTEEVALENGRALFADSSQSAGTEATPAP